MIFLYALIFILSIGIKKKWKKKWMKKSALTIQAALLRAHVLIINASFYKAFIYLVHDSDNDMGPFIIQTCGLSPYST